MKLKNSFEKTIAFGVRDILVARYPHTFFHKGYRKKPLKLGIWQDIRHDSHISHFELRLCLGDYCGGPSYHACLIEGAPRIALDGSVAGYVTKNEAEHAAEVFAQFPEHIRLRWRPETKGPTEPGSSTGPVGQSFEGSTL
jgi:sRNA-binding protein